MTSILYIRAMGHETPAFLELPGAKAMTAKFLREISEADFDRFDAILVPAHIDQKGFSRFSPALVRFLNRGGTLVFNGHLVYPVLPELESFIAAPGGHMEDLIVERVGEHPVFEGVDEHDLSFRRGVAGFYGRGANPPPPGARILHRLKASGLPLDWYWERPAGGRILMHGGNTLWMYVDDATSAARIAPQLLDWLATLPARRACDGTCKKTPRAA
jgi:hypothetical protein